MSRRIVIDLERSEAPIAGSIAGPDLETTFIGWLELLAGLDRALAVVPAPAPDHGREPFAGASPTTTEVPAT